MNLEILQTNAKKFVSDNSAAILTGVGVVGTIATGVLSGRAGFRAAMDIRKAEFDPVEVQNDELPGKDRVKIAAPHFVSPILVGSATVASVVMANRMSAKRAAALMAAYSLSEKHFEEYRAKVIDKIGLNKEDTVKGELAQQRVSDTPQKEVIILSGGDVLCFDQYTGRYFRSTHEQIKQAELKVNADLFNHEYASLSSFYTEVGLAPTTFSDDVGWSHQVHGHLEVLITTTSTANHEPCLAIDFARSPTPDYTQRY